MTTTNTELIAEARQYAIDERVAFGADAPLATMLDRLAAALEAATSITEERVETAYKAWSEHRAGRTYTGTEHAALHSEFEWSAVRAALTAALTEGERR